MPHHAKAAGWIAKGERKWFFRCDQCGRWRLVCYYYEVYPLRHSKSGVVGWWYACADCLVSTVSALLEEGTSC